MCVPGQSAATPKNMVLDLQERSMFSCHCGNWIVFSKQCLLVSGSPSVLLLHAGPGEIGGHLQVSCWGLTYSVCVCVSNLRACHCITTDRLVFHRSPCVNVSPLLPDGSLGLSSGLPPDVWHTYRGQGSESQLLGLKEEWLT